MTEFISWETLGTYAGALAMVMVLTQFTKNLAFVAKIPTQIWSFILALVVLYPSMFFLGYLNASTAIQTIFNAVIISIAANGGYTALKRVTGTNVDGAFIIDTNDPEKDIYQLKMDSLDGLPEKKTVVLRVDTETPLQ